MTTWRGKSAKQWLAAAAEEQTPIAASAAPRIDAIAQLIETAPAAARGRRLRLRLGYWGLGFAAAAAAALFGATALRGRAPSVVPGMQVVAVTNAVRVVRDGGGRNTAQVGVVISERDLVVTEGQGRATLELASGAHVVLESSTSLRMLGAPSENSKELRESALLESGRVNVRVPKLEPGASLSIITPDTRVTVVGTRFSVWIVRTPSGMFSCVGVEEGRVKVEAEHKQALLAAGEVWASVGDDGACDSAIGQLPEKDSSGNQPTPNQGRSNNEPPVVTPAQPHEKGPPRPQAPAGASAASSLAEENRLFLRCIQARRARHFSEALTLDDQFLTRYPNSTLVSQMREERAETERAMKR